VNKSEGDFIKFVAISLPSAITAHVDDTYCATSNRVYLATHAVCYDN